jgi:hypothetical protein
MMTERNLNLIASAFLAAVASATTVAHGADPLPSWNNGPAKQAIIAFVEKVTKPGSPDFVPAPERIAAFDNDGTLWSEQPVPVQFYFVADRVKALAPDHPEWKAKEPFASLLKGDLKKALEGGDHGLMELFMVTHTGMTSDEFAQLVQDWIASAKHPQTGKRFLDMTYQPMLEVLDYLRANGFKNFIIAAASPFNLRDGPIGAFTAGHDNPAIDKAIIGYVSTFEKIGAGEKLNPHVSTGNAPTTYLDQMNAEPFEPFTFSPAGARTLVRVRAEVVALEPGSHRLQCQAYMVSGAGDSFFEDEHRLANLRSGPYRRLLEEVAKRLKAH